jgi:hypothetical protein
MAWTARPTTRAEGDVLMTDPLTPLPFTFQELTALAWAKIYRHEDTAVLYALEEQAMEAIARAASELQRLFNIDANRPMTIEDELLLKRLPSWNEVGRPVQSRRESWLAGTVLTSPPKNDGSRN